MMAKPQLEHFAVQNVPLGASGTKHLEAPMTSQLSEGPILYILRSKMYYDDLPQVNKGFAAIVLLSFLLVSTLACFLEYFAYILHNKI